MVELADMKFFVCVVNAGSLSAAGRQLGFSAAVASKRLARMESQLNVRLLQRNSRRLALTEEGALYLERCRQILADVEELECQLGGGKLEVKGTLHVSCPVALGRHWIGPALAEFVREWPELRVRLSLSDQVVDLLEHNFDCAIRIGGAEDSRLVCRTLAQNRRIICASPDYLALYGTPLAPVDLAGHQAVLLSPQLPDSIEWRFFNARDKSTASAKVPVRMATDSGEQAHAWAKAGFGLIRRSEWDLRAALSAGELIEVLPDWRGEEAPIRVLFPSRQFLPARTRLFIDFLIAFFERDEPRVG